MNKLLIVLLALLILPISVMATNPTDYPDGLQKSWALNDSGTTALCIGVHCANLTVTANIWETRNVSNQTWRYAHLNTSNSFSDITHPTELSDGLINIPEATWGHWQEFQASSQVNAWGIVVSGSSRVYTIPSGYFSGNYQTSCTLNTEPGNVYYQIDSPANIVLNGSWHHVLCWYNASAGSGNFRLYIDGQQVVNTTATGNIDFEFGPGTTEFHLPQIMTGSDYINVRQIGVWNTSLSETQIQSLAQQIIPNELAWYTGENSWADSSKNGYDLLYRDGVQIVSGGKLGSAFSFTGSGVGAYTNPNNAFMSGNAPHSYCYWLNTTILPTSGNNGYHLGVGQNAGDNAASVGFSNPGTGTVYQTRTPSNGNNSYEITWQAGTWDYICDVYNPNSNLYDIYYNGVKYTQINSLPSPVTFTSSSLIILGNDVSENTAQAMNGLLDDVRIYDFSLSTGQVNWLYNNGAGRTQSLANAPPFYLLEDSFEGPATNTTTSPFCGENQSISGTWVTTESTPGLFQNGTIKRTGLYSCQAQAKAGGGNYLRLNTWVYSAKGNITVAVWAYKLLNDSTGNDFNGLGLTTGGDAAVGTAGGANGYGHNPSLNYTDWNIYPTTHAGTGIELGQWIRYMMYFDGTGRSITYANNSIVSNVSCGATCNTIGRIWVGAQGGNTGEPTYYDDLQAWYGPPSDEPINVPASINVSITDIKWNGNTQSIYQNLFLYNITANTTNSNASSIALNISLQYPNGTYIIFESPMIEYFTGSFINESTHKLEISGLYNITIKGYDNNTNATGEVYAQINVPRSFTDLYYNGSSAVNGSIINRYLNTSVYANNSISVTNFTLTTEITLANGTVLYSNTTINQSPQNIIWDLSTTPLINQTYYYRAWINDTSQILVANDTYLPYRAFFFNRSIAFIDTINSVTTGGFITNTSYQNEIIQSIAATINLSDSTEVSLNVSLQYPNGTYIIFEQNMTNITSRAYEVITNNQLEVNGTYLITVKGWSNLFSAALTSKIQGLLILPSYTGLYYTVNSTTNGTLTARFITTDVFSNNSASVQNYTINTEIYNNVSALVANWTTIHNGSNSNQTILWDFDNNPLLSDGLYTYRSWINDTGTPRVANETYLSLISFNLDQNVPIVTVNSIAQNDLIQTHTVLIDFNATDRNGISKLWYYNGTQNVTYTTPANIILGEGIYSYFFYANDTINNIGVTNINFTVNVPHPVWTNNGKVGGAYLFDGINDYIRTNNSIGTLQAITMWLNNGTGWHYFANITGITYLDGNLSNSTAPYYVNATEILFVGVTSNNVYYNGTIDEVEVYTNTSLTVTQMRINYELGLLGYGNYILSDQQLQDLGLYSAYNGTGTSNSFTNDNAFNTQVNYMQLDFAPLPTATVNVNVRTKILKQPQNFTLNFYGTADNVTFNVTGGYVIACIPDNLTDCVESQIFQVPLQTYTIVVNNSAFLNNCTFTNQLLISEITSYAYDCFLYDAVINVSARNSYTNSSIQPLTGTIYFNVSRYFNETNGFGVYQFLPDYFEQQNTTTGNITIGTQKNLTLDYLFINSSTHFGQQTINYTPTLTNNNVQRVLNQTVITIVLQDTVSHAPLVGLYINVCTNTTNANPQCINTTTGNFTFNPAAGTNWLTAGVNSVQYANITTNFTFTALENDTQYFNINPLFGVFLKDEATDLPFNISRTANMQFITFCDAGTFATDINLTNPTIQIPCNFTSFKITVDYGNGTQYYRTWLYSASEVFNQTLYLIDLTTTQSIVNQFAVDDLFAGCANPAIYIYKFINNANPQITAAHTDIEGKMSAYLILNDQYQVSVGCTGQPLRAMGTYSADTSGQKTLRLYSISLAITPTGFSETGSGSISLQKLGTNTTYFAVGTYNDTAALTTFAQFNIYGGNSVGDNASVLLATQTVTGVAANNVVFTQNISSYVEADAYPVIYGHISIIYNSQNYTLGNVLYYGQNNTGRVPFSILDGGFVTQNTINWIITILISIIAIYATMRSANLVSLGLIGFAALLVAFKWYTLGWGVLGLAAFVAVIVVLKEGEQRP